MRLKKHKIVYRHRTGIVVSHHSNTGNWCRVGRCRAGSCTQHELHGLIYDFFRKGLEAPKYRLIVAAGTLIRRAGIVWEPLFTCAAHL